MTRTDASLFCREQLNKYGLKEWSVRLNNNPETKFLGLCSYKDKAIILNGYHCELHSENEVRNTILHEVAHALMPGHGHNSLWAAKAREIGCTNTLSCGTVDVPASVVEAIRSGAQVEVEHEEQLITTTKYRITQLKDKCEVCHKEAVELFHLTSKNANGDEVKFITLKCGHTRTKIFPKGTAFDTLVSNWWDDRVKTCKHDWDKNKCNNCGEFRPFEFQVGGMRFLEQALVSGKGGAVFDEMGLGKTVQSLGYINFHPEVAPVLFVVKSGIKFQWFKEIYRWLGPEWIPQVIQTSKDFILPGMKAYIISYDIVVPKIRTSKTGTISKSGLDINRLVEAIKPKLVILDECQQIKNPDSSRTQNIRRVITTAEAKVIPLSGTPWKNRGSEFFTVLNMINPTRFHSFAAFKQDWVNHSFGPSGTVKELGIKNPEKFKEHIKDIAIRRERIDVMKELPLITRNKYHAEVKENEKEIYDEEVSNFVKWYNDLVMSGEEDKMFQPGEDNLLAKMARMRHLAGLAKIPATVEFVKEFIEETDKKIVVFVHHKDVAQIMVERFKKELDIPVLIIHAGLTSEERFSVQERFNQTPKCVMIASTLASGEGLNLQTCSDCVMHERQWNPANEEQAEGRFIRIGQTSTTVTATYTTAVDTIDEHLDAIVERKRLEFHNAMNKGVMPVWNQNGLAKELADRIAESFNKKNRKKDKELVRV